MNFDEGPHCFDTKCDTKWDTSGYFGKTYLTGS